MTTQCVRLLEPKNRTPRSRAPSVHRNRNLEKMQLAGRRWGGSGLGSFGPGPGGSDGIAAGPVLAGTFDLAFAFCKRGGILLSVSGRETSAAGDAGCLF
jgi:hypothetical protein